MKRVFDIWFSLIALTVSAPILLLAIVGIKVCSRGPVLYPAHRVGRYGRTFTMYKFRTMHLGVGGSVITNVNDPRIFKLGILLRRTKLDEFPQFLNVLMGQMSVVGPRPEDPKIVARAYRGWMHDTLNCRPGLTSPGAIYYYASGRMLVKLRDPEGSYCATVLPRKLAIDRAYLDRATALTDLWIIARTGVAIVGMLVGAKVQPARKDLARADHWLV